MLFVPLPLVATPLLGVLFVRFVLTRSLASQAHQCFAALIGLYALQSLLSSLRWGYGLSGLAPFIALLAPVLPALAYLSYQALAGRNTGRRLWPLAIVLINWAALAVAPDIADLLILVTYLGFGGLLLVLCWRGADRLTLSPFNNAREILVAMCLTGIALLASGLTDVYVIYDFIRNEGENAGFVLSLGQTIFVLVIGISAAFGRATSAPAGPKAEPSVAVSDPTREDAEILQRLQELFELERLHTREDLSLRRLSRRLGVPDKAVSNAINRSQQMSVSQFVNSFRIKEACRLLAETDDPVLDISLASGFATKSNFNREFSRITGRAPSQWRNEHRKAR